MDTKVQLTSNDTNDCVAADSSADRPRAQLQTSRARGTLERVNLKRIQIVDLSYSPNTLISIIIGRALYSNKGSDNFLTMASVRIHVIMRKSFGIIRFKTKASNNSLLLTFLFRLP